MSAYDLSSSCNPIYGSSYAKKDSHPVRYLYSRNPDLIIPAQKLFSQCLGILQVLRVKDTITIRRPFNNPAHTPAVVISSKGVKLYIEADRGEALLRTTSEDGRTPEKRIRYSPDPENPEAVLMGCPPTIKENNLTLRLGSDGKIANHRTLYQIIKNLRYNNLTQHGSEFSRRN